MLVDKCLGYLYELQLCRKDYIDSIELICMTDICNEDIVKLGFTGEKERILQISWSSPNTASIYLFKDLTMEFVDMLASQNMLRQQTKPIPGLAVPFELKDVLEEEPKPVELTEEAMKILRSSTNEYQGLSEEKKALAEQVVFEEDDETGSGLFRMVCQLNKDCKVTYTIPILSNVANGLECTSFSIQKTNTAATVKVVLRSGSTLDLVMTIGLNEEKQRVLHGTYPESQAAYGRQFWIRFAESLASNGFLLGQKLSLPQRATHSNTQTASSSTDIQKEDDLADDSGLEYDSSSDSENSVDSDTD